MPELAVRLRWAFVLSFVMALVLPFIVGGWKWRVSLGLLLVFWIVVTVLQNVWSRLGPSEGSDFFTKLRTTARSYYGMQLAHLGVAVFIAGVTVVTSYQTERDVKMNVGDTVNVGGYDFQLRNLAQLQGPNYQAMRADIEVTKNGARVATLHPEKHAYTVAQSVTSETAIDRSIFRDLYVALGEQVDNRAWTVRVYHKPLVNWIWGGALLMALGGAFAVSDRRYALAAKKSRETLARTTEPAGTGATTPASGTTE